MSPSTDSITYSSPNSDDHGPLRAMARQSFSETFAQHYEPERFGEFLDHACGPGGTMERDLEDPTIRWRMAVHESRPIGYAKLTPLRAPAPTPLPDALELQQICVSRRCHGRGVAPSLMEWAIIESIAAHVPEIYLTVFDHNERAKRFYRRHGFTEVGRCTFTLGERVDDDRIWRPNRFAPT